MSAVWNIRVTRRPRGFTLVELVLTIGVAGLAALAAMMVFGAQDRASNSTRAQVDAQQNARAAMDAMVRELRLAGSNIDRFHRQVALVDAAPYQVAFNGDVRSDVGGEVAMPATESIPLADGTSYSPGAFLDENLEDLTQFNNGAETVRFTFDTDNSGTVSADDTLSSTVVAEDFQLVRQVNGGAAASVALGLRGPLARSDGTLPPPMFQYLGRFGGGTDVTLWGDANDDGELSHSEIAALTPVSRTQLQNIREIVVTVETVANDASREGDAREGTNTLLTTTVRPRNIGLNASNLSACGNPPMPPTSLIAVDTPDDGGRSITITFVASYDDLAGENDVREYTIYRRRVGQSSFGPPIYHIQAADQSNYSFINDQTRSKRAEDAPEDGIQYEYYVTAWDCEPQESNPSDLAGPVISQPNGPEPPTIVEVFDTPCDAGGDVTVRFTASSDDQAQQPSFTGYRVYRGTSPGITAYKVRVLDVDAAAQTQYTVHDLTNELLPMSSDSTYYYVVRGVRSEVESVDSNQWGPVMVTDGLARPTLRDVEDMPGDFGQRLQVTWDASPSESCPAPDNVVMYEVFRKGEMASFWTSVTTQSAGLLPVYSHADTLVTPGVTYTYKVQARSAAGDMIESNEKSGEGTAENQLVPPPGFLAQDEPCDPLGAIRITWQPSPNDPVGEMTHYRVFRGLAPGVYDYEMPWVDADGRTSYALLDDQANSGARAPVLGVTYYYVARSWNEFFSLQSGPTNESVVTAESTPTAPDNTAASDTPNDGGRSITVVFGRSDHDGSCDNTVTSYRIYRGTNPSVLGTFLGSVTAVQMATYTFNDNLVYSLDPPFDGVQYYYGVRAYASELVSKLSNVAGPAVAVHDGTSNEIIWQDNFEVDRGWTHGQTSGFDTWERSTVNPVAVAVTFGRPDPTTATSGTFTIGTAIGPGAILYARNSSCWMATPSIDCRNASRVKLKFNRWLNVERNARDLADIEVRSASSGYVRVWRNPSSDLTDNAWSSFELDITAHAANKDGVKVRFILTSNSSNEFTGWNIDDFVLEKY